MTLTNHRDLEIPGLERASEDEEFGLKYDFGYRLPRRNLNAESFMRSNKQEKEGTPSSPGVEKGEDGLAGLAFLGEKE